MRFAIAAIDRYLGVFEAFVKAGWTPLKLFTVPMKSDLANQQAVIAFAEANKAAIQLSRLNERDLADLREQGCEALIVASYDWKVCDWRPYLKYGINFHPSPLPEGRGPYPSVRAILENRNSWAVTCHRLAPEIDAGDILTMTSFPLQADECHESLDLKIQMATKQMAAKVAVQFIQLWDQAKPQGQGSYWKKYSIAAHIVDFNKPVDVVLRHIRAFGTTESLANVNNTWLIVKRAIGWTEKHGLKPGQVIHVYNQCVVVTALDGYVGLLDSNLAPPSVIADMKAETIVKA